MDTPHAELPRPGYVGVNESEKTRKPVDADDHMPDEAVPGEPGRATTGYAHSGKPQD